MMGKILILPDELSSKIAAGEVIERPASIVKELVENSLDAGATDLKVDLEQGGCISIRVMDNGEGIAPDDVERAFERFATSKIYQFDDIYQVQSFGFRGEALPSIAAISRIEIITRHRDALSGIRAVAGGGRVVISEAGCPVGTSVFVSEIFENVPARKKFLKSEKTEQGACLDVITRLALVHPAVYMRVRINGHEHLNIPKTNDIGERIALVMGGEFSGNFIPIRGSAQGVELTGYISKQDFTRASSRYIYCFVNKRFVRDPLLNHAIRNAYRNVIEQNRHPSAVVLLQLPSQDVDVNVHPAKLEVRFRDSQLIYGLVLESITSALSSATTDSDFGMSWKSSKNYWREKAGAAVPVQSQDIIKQYIIAPTTAGTMFGDRFTRKSSMDFALKDDEQHSVLQERKVLSDSKSIIFSNFEYLGRIAGVYLVLCIQQGMVIVDQHAAHERILFEKFRRRDAGTKGMSQHMLVPETMNLSPKDYATVMDNIQHFNDAGLEIEPFGGLSVVIKAVPVELSNLDPKALLRGLVEEIHEADRYRIQEDSQRNRTLAAMACKGAIKANDSLSPAEAVKLCLDLGDTPNSATCPHGRPVYRSFPARELEKMFRRS
jgi:DNA mismatch repair protein MutL